MQLVIRRMARVYHALGEKEKEIAELNELVALAHDSQPCWLELAERYIEMQLYDLAKFVTRNC